MSKRRVYFRYVESGVLGLVELYDEFAPTTCETLWNALERPVRAEAFHAMSAGPEVMLGVPPEAQTFDPRAIPPENQSCFPAAGECIWFYQAPHALYGFADELWELGIFYANGGSLFGVAGWTPCNVWGRMTENLEAFSADCRDIRRNGIKIVEFGRWDDQ